MSATRRITLCADDFAWDEATSSGILELAGNGSISAVSSFAEAPTWPEAGQDLARLRDRVLLGLHFNLTQRFDASRSTLKKTILASLLRRLDPASLRRQLRQQLERFAEVVGVWPDYVDGHEHVHAFPVVAEVVRQVATEIRPDAPIPVRAVAHFFGPTDAPFKRSVIRRLAALGGAGRSNPGQPLLNSSFAGDYSLRPDADFAGLFAGWLEAVPDRGLIMCHPRRDAAGAPPSAGQREFAYLGSDEALSARERQSIRFLQRSELGTENRA
jgi:predicted glycoside hydrolase/deacetylase ChbG (UPF0249 family)